MMDTAALPSCLLVTLIDAMAIGIWLVTLDVKKELKTFRNVLVLTVLAGASAFCLWLVTIATATS